MNMGEGRPFYVLNVCLCLLQLLVYRFSCKIKKTLKVCNRRLQGRHSKHPLPVPTPVGGGCTWHLKAVSIEVHIKQIENTYCEQPLWGAVFRCVHTQMLGQQRWFHPGYFTTVGRHVRLSHPNLVSQTTSLYFRLLWNSWIVNVPACKTLECLLFNSIRAVVSDGNIFLTSRLT